MAHIHELIDYTVETYVVFENKVLLRFHDKYNIWLSVGGHIELDENPNEAAVREVKEEVGLDIALHDQLRPFEMKNDSHEELIPPHFLNIHKISDSHRHITMVYFAKSTSDNVIEGEGEKSCKWKWMAKDEIENASDIQPDKKYYALKALELLTDKTMI